MGLRRFTEKESRACTSMVRAWLEQGADPADTAAQLVRYLIMQGWLPGPAKRRAAILVKEIKEQLQKSETEEVPLLCEHCVEKHHSGFVTPCQAHGCEHCCNR